MMMMEDVINWIKQTPKHLWRGTENFGDQYCEDSDHLLLQRSIGLDGKGYHSRGITIQCISVAKNDRRKGKASQMLIMIENTSKEQGLSYVFVQSACSKEIIQLLQKREGYQHKSIGHEDFSGDYIKTL